MGRHSPHRTVERARKKKERRRGKKRGKKEAWRAKLNRKRKKDENNFTGVEW